MGCVKSKLKLHKRADEALQGAKPVERKKKARTGSLTGEAKFKRELSTINEAMVQLHMGVNIRKYYDGLGERTRKSRHDNSARSTSQNLAKERLEAGKKEGFLGSGNWGTVRVVTRKDDGRRFACKILRLSKQMSARRRQELLDEIIVLSKLDHPHIAKLYETYEEEGLNMYLVMELLEGGELFKRLTIDSPNGRFTEDQARHATRQMTSALAYLHSRDIIHRDLKLENFVYRKPGGDELVLIDFGLSVKYKQGGRGMGNLTSVCGSSYYLSPEVMMKKYGIECDVWSLGVIVYMLLSGTPPFRGDTEQKIMASAMTGVYSMTRAVWKTVSDEAKDFVRRCLVKDIPARMTAQEALEHPWIKHDFHDDDQTSSDDSTSGVHSLASFESNLGGDIVQSLRQYSNFAYFRKIALQAVAFQLSHEEIHKLEEAFKRIDVDGDGYITYEELEKELLNNHKISVSECREIFDAMDFDKTGKIHFNEFIAAALDESYYHDELVIQHAFNRLDLDSDGYIDVDELKRTFKDKINDSHYIGSILEEVINRNKRRGLQGKIAVKDFIKIMREGHENSVPHVQEPMPPNLPQPMECEGGRPAVESEETLQSTMSIDSNIVEASNSMFLDEYAIGKNKRRADPTSMEVDELRENQILDQT